MEGLSPKGREGWHGPAEQCSDKKGGGMMKRVGGEGDGAGVCMFMHLSVLALLVGLLNGCSSWLLLPMRVRVGSWSRII